MEEAIKVLEDVQKEINEKIKENQEFIDKIEPYQIKKAAIMQKNEWILRLKQTSYLIWRLKNESTK